MKTVFFLLFLFTLQGVYAQNENTSRVSLTGGYNTLMSPDLFESNYGFHLAANLYDAQIERIDWDYQLSVNYNAGFNQIFNVNVFLGSRIYFNKPENKNRYFLTAHNGFSYIHEWGEDFIESKIDYGYSLGLFAALNQFIIGFSAERPEVFIFKLGFIF